MQIEQYLQQALADETSNNALYERLASALRKGIHQGDLLDESEALPSERDLATILDISRVTVRKAIQVLVSEGLLIQKRGAGTFIAKRVEQALSHLTSFSEDMEQRHLNAGIVWLERHIGMPSAEECQILKLESHERIARLYRLRTANDQPMALELAVLPEHLITDPTQVSGSLYEFLGRSGNRPVRAIQRLRAVPCSTEQAVFLRISPGSPVLYIERYSFHANGSPVEFTRSHYRGDSYDFVSEMTLQQR